MVSCYSSLHKTYSSSMLRSMRFWASPSWGLWIKLSLWYIGQVRSRCNSHQRCQSNYLGEDSQSSLPSRESLSQWCSDLGVIRVSLKGSLWLKAYFTGRQFGEVTGSLRGGMQWGVLGSPKIDLQGLWHQPLVPTRSFPSWKHNFTSFMKHYHILCVCLIHK